MNINIPEQINSGNTIIGIEMGSTRIKAVLIGPDNTPIASGGFGWENTLKEGVWTYSMDEVWDGVKSSYASLINDIKEKYNANLTKVKAIGISGMMHGYLVFDKDDNQLTPFRTWRNNMTEGASTELTELFNYPIPQRWSIAHLYQSILNKEEHVGKIDYITTLAGYVHWKLTGQKVMGIGEASGMFPIDLEKNDFNMAMTDKFDNHTRANGYNWKLKNILPKVLVAGENAGTLSAEGALLLDPSGDLLSGISLCDSYKNLCLCRC